MQTPKSVEREREKQRNWLVKLCLSLCVTAIQLTCGRSSEKLHYTSRERRRFSVRERESIMVVDITAVCQAPWRERRQMSREREREEKQTANVERERGGFNLFGIVE